jgi:hypothetical protein
MQELKAYNVRDEEVRTVKINFFRILINFIAIIPYVLVNLVFSFAGLIILTPLGMLNSYLAEKARRQALATSSVKVIGVDVMASKKMTTTMILYPILCIGFSTFLFFVLGRFEVPFTYRALWTTLFFICFPVYCYICILARDNLIHYYKIF